MTKASTTQKRQPKGTSTGGQFAASVNPESTVLLDAAGVMASTSPEVQSGYVFDTVAVVDQYEINGDWHNSTTQFHRRRPGVFGGTPYEMRIQANRPLSDDEMGKMAGLMGYAYRATIAGEPIGGPMRDSPYSFVVSSDMTKSSRDDLGMGLEDFEDILPAMFEHGSPIRKTDRAGAGTKGTRLFEGFGSDLAFEIYYDDVVDFNDPQNAGNRAQETA
jgi:hypothetical protein